jgi:predicted nucleotidyltransferase component of viral defense system
MITLLSEIFKPKEGMTYQQATLYSREVLQKIILNGLSRGNFFKKAAFHGGTALRILHSLDRYSEDLDFSLFQKDLDFKLERYLSYAESEIGSYGLNVTTKIREPGEGNIRTGNLGCNTREIVMEVGFPEEIIKQIHSGLVTKVKIDVNIDPPEGAHYVKYSMKDPLNYYLCALDLPSLFAGKTAAVLCRGWNNRTKGRDLYDFLWYIQNNTPLNMEYLKSNLVRQNAIGEDENLDISTLREMLRARFESIDYRSAMDDISRFVLDDRIKDDWAPKVFIEASEKLRSE